MMIADTRLAFNQRGRGELKNSPKLSGWPQDSNLKIEWPKTMKLCEAYLKKKTIGSVVIEILSFRQKTYYYM